MNWSARHPLAARRPQLRVVAWSTALILGVAGPAAPATYYVDAQSGTCSNTGAGTETQPYCTISAAVAAHNGPGITILVKPGVYREQVTIPTTGSGLSGQPFVLQATGPGVVIDGADDCSSAGLWAVATGPVWKAASVTWAPLQVFVDGNRLTPTTVSTPDSVPVNGFSWISSQGLCVNLGSSSPGTHQTLVGHRLYGFNLPTRSFVTIDGFQITRHESRGINMQTGCTDLVISHNTVSYANSYGIQTVNGTRVEIAANTVSYCNYHGIGLTAGANNCSVHDNESFRNVDPAVRRANGIYSNAAVNNMLFRNRLHDNQDTGMHFAGGANNSVCFNNRSWNNGDHGFDHLASSGNTHTHDVAYGNYKDGFSVEGNSPDTKFFNCISVNNGLTTGEYDMWCDSTSSVGFVSDYNLFWNSTTQNPFKFISTQYASLAQYQAASGQDAHSKQADPRFTNGAAGDFRLMAGSPAIDAANSGVANWPSTDAAGGVRLDDPATANTGAGPIAYGDLGALEFVPTAPPPPADKPPVVSAPGTVKATTGATVTFTVTASDPDGDAIASLVMLPTGAPSGASFTASADHKSGTFSWPTGTFSGAVKVSFVAANALRDTAVTSIQVKKASRKDAEATGLEGGVLALSNAFPNPTHGAVEFALDLPHPSDVRWAVFDLQGREVWSELRALPAGRTMLHWDGTRGGQGPAATGIYLVRAAIDGTVFTRRVVRFQ